jgi:hypothetical protein
MYDSPSDIVVLVRACAVVAVMTIIEGADGVSNGMHRW